MKRRSVSCHNLLASAVLDPITACLFVCFLVPRLWVDHGFCFSTCLSYTLVVVAARPLGARVALFSLPMWRCSTARCEARSHFYLRILAVITDQGLLIPLGHNHDFNVLPHAGLTASTHCVYLLDSISRICRAGPRPPCRSLAQMQRNTYRPTGAGPKDELLWTRALRHCTPFPRQVESGLKIYFGATLTIQ
ncbi:hypothetical protein BKA80DRAFT_279501 [Phyllosticta citrichinensis]